MGIRHPLCECKRTRTYRYLHQVTMLLNLESVPQPDDAADVVQEVFLAVATHVAGFQGGGPGNTFRGWLWTIARNKIRDHFRRRQGQALAQGGSDAQRRLAQIPDSAAPEKPQAESCQSPGPDAPPDAVWIDRGALELIRAEFEERTWTAFIRSAVDGLRSADIADELGMTKRAVRQAKYRVLRRLRQELAGLLD